MSYAIHEVSTETGEPVELYTFLYTGKAWYLTNATQAVRYDNRDFVPTQVRRGELNIGSDSTKATCDIELPFDSEIASLFIVQPPSEVVSVTILCAHISDTILDPVVIWKGRVVQSNWKGVICTLNTENVFSSLERPGVTRKYSRQCTHTLYSKACGVDIKKHEFDVTVTGLEGSKISLNNPKPGQMGGGILRYKNSITGAIERRPITVDAAGFILVNISAIGLNVGDTATLVMGCPHTMDACDTIFANAPNYGGQPYVPALNPFGNSSLW